MTRSLPLVRLSPFLILLLATAALGGPPPRLTSGAGAVVHGGVVGADKAALVDTVLLLGPWGSGSLCNGQFQAPDGTPYPLNDPANLNAWTSCDLTARTQPIWHVDTYHAVSGLWSAWCGESGYAACSGLDVAGGYGNNYDERLDWIGTVADPGLPATVRLTGLLDHDVEPGYDTVALICIKRDQPEETLLLVDGNGAAVAVDQTAVYEPEDYLGDGGDQVRLQWRVTSDTGWSDADCLYPSAGACRVDDLTVTLTQGTTDIVTFDDFEDGSLGANWSVSFTGAVGDFAQIWTGLEDIDACATNYSAQAAFVDDGLVVPGTDGTFCINWCYGPGGYILNHDGGLLGAGHFLSNVVESPVLAMPEGDYGYALLAFDVYRHQPLDGDAPLIGFTWAVRSTTGDAADIASQPWRDRNFLYLGGAPAYERLQLPVGDLLEPGRTHVQVRLGVLQLQAWDWSWRTDGTPAPYFDNVRLAVAPYPGPLLSAATAELANDGFPACGTVDLGEPGALSVRFDMAANIAPAVDLRLDPGDSIVARISAVRTGAVIEPGSVRLHYVLDANPVFDGWRSAGLPATGSVAGVPAAVGVVTVPDLWAFDLPDTGFLFPGDVLHYYIEAADNAGGDLRTATLPADLTGFGEFVTPPVYDPRFTVRALPGLDPAPYAGQILIWVDGGDPADWHQLMATLHRDDPFPYDLYTTRAPDSGLGNGLGARATTAQLAGYRTIVYTAGDLDRFTLGNGDFESDPSADLDRLDAWLQLGGKGLFLCGDNLASDLAMSGAEGTDFLNDRMGLTWLGADLRDLISNQAAPLIRASGFYPGSWIANGGCPGINTFDVVETQAWAVRLAEFTDPNGSSGAYSYAAATWCDLTPFGSRVISLPYDLTCVVADPGDQLPLTDFQLRQALLHTLLDELGVRFPVPPDAVPGTAARFQVALGPNPFNPIVRIAYTLPREDRLTVTIFNVRGARVRVLHDERTPAGSGVLTWDGTDDGGAAVASGVYFYAANTSREEKIGKVTLVK